MYFKLPWSKYRRSAVIKYQNHLLRKTMKYVYENSPFYRSRFKERGIKYDDISRKEDLTKLQFFTIPQHIQADPFQFLAVPREEIQYMMSTAGTAGKPKVIFYTKNDMSKLVENMVRGLDFLGVSKKDVAQICYCYGQPFWLVGPTLQRGLEEAGCFIIPSGNQGRVEGQIELMTTYGTTLLFGTPSFIHRLTEEGRKIVDLRSLKIRMITLGAEPFSESFREYLEKNWDAKVYDSYGLAEMGYLVAGECSAQNGLHTVADTLVEIVDPKTGEVVEYGEVGELVFTTLSRQGVPLIRYRSGDISRFLNDETCDCGIPTDKIARIKGRVDDMTFLGTGENVFPVQFDEALLPLSGVLGYQLIIDKEGYKDALYFNVETDAPSEELRQKIVERLYRVPFLNYDITASKTIAEPVIKFVKPGELLGNDSIKAKRFIDERFEKNTYEIS